MKISLSDLGKRFNHDWIFRRFNYEFIAGQSYAITGPNGSGKSTLLQVIAGAIGTSEGKIEYHTGNQSLATSHTDLPHDKKNSLDINPDEAFRLLSIAAPYLEVIEEMTATEFFRFHTAFKPLLPGYSAEKIISVTGLEAAAHKQIRYYSSGMKQRVKLAQAIFSDVPCVLLDEPCTNLDAAGIELYQQLIASYCKDRLVIVSSNDEQEYGFCKERIDMLQYK